jgi:hypothetical protein
VDSRPCMLGEIDRIMAMFEYGDPRAELLATQLSKWYGQAVLWVV